jgi:hypothetical protein
MEHNRQRTDKKGNAVDPSERDPDVIILVLNQRLFSKFKKLVKERSSWLLNHGSERLNSLQIVNFSLIIGLAPQVNNSPPKMSLQLFHVNGYRAEDSR